MPSANGHPALHVNGGRCMRVLRAPLLPAAALAAALLAACGRAPAAPHRGVAQVSRIGIYTVRKISLPPSAVVQAFPRAGPYVLAGPDTLLRVSTTAPYTVARKTLGKDGWTPVTALDCAQQPYFAQSDGPEVVLVCAGPVGSTANRLLLIDPQGAIQAVSMPVSIPVPLSRAVVSTEQFDGARGGLIWQVALNGEPPTLYGQGLVDLGTGRSGSLPTALRALRYYDPTAYTMLGTNDALYEMRYASNQAKTAGVYRWSAASGSWTFLGDVPHVRYAYGEAVVAADGSLWQMAPVRPSAGLVYDWRIDREVPGSRQVQTWRIDGDVLGVGPGYFAYLPGADPTTLVVRFPLQHRSLKFTDLSGNPGMPYLMNDPAIWDSGWSRLTGTQVIILGALQGVRELLVAP